jgi:hypothetical protein
MLTQLLLLLLVLLLVAPATYFSYVTAHYLHYICHRLHIQQCCCSWQQVLAKCRRRR